MTIHNYYDYTHIVTMTTDYGVTVICKTLMFTGMDIRDGQ